MLRWLLQEEGQVNTLKYDNVTDVQRDKQQFVRKHIKGLVKALDPCVTRVEYKIRDNEEFVVLSYGDRPDKFFCVTADSLVALARDVLRGM